MVRTDLVGIYTQDLATGTRPVSRAEAVASYKSLPIPDTTEEHWRFTDLKDFDPDSFGQVQGTVPGTSPAATMLELDVAGMATITEAVDRERVRIESLEVRKAPRLLGRVRERKPPVALE